MFEWIQFFADWLIYDIFGVAADTQLGEALNFFVYDTIKILFLLFLITFIMGIVNSYFPVDKLRNFLSRNKLYGLEYLAASVFGAITPFCSCSSVPLFIGFVRGGIPLGVTFAFLITSPLVNEIAIAIFLGMFGLKTTLIYVVSGILLGVLGGFVLSKLNLEPLLSDWVQKAMANSESDEDYDESKQTFWERLPAIRNEAWEIVRSVTLYVIIGIGIGAAMHGYVPEGFFEEYISAENPLAVPLATVLAVPLYANAAGILPVIQVLVAKGVPLGTAIAFMMATIGLSIPEAMLMKKVMTVKLIVIYFSVEVIFIIFSGYLFNWIL
ncbi:MAG: permease [Bernardetiaceae bacterium]|nr:permease [Bernardetiaceae bacterium]